MAVIYITGGLDHCSTSACVVVDLRSLESLHRKELDNNRLLRQQLSSAQSAVRQLNDTQKEAATLKRKVAELQNVQSVINGEQLSCFSWKIISTCSFSSGQICGVLRYHCVVIRRIMIIITHTAFV